MCLYFYIYILLFSLSLVYHIYMADMVNTKNQASSTFMLSR